MIKCSFFKTQKDYIPHVKMYIYLSTKEEMKTLMASVLGINQFMIFPG